MFLAIKKICDIYDWDGKGVLDMYFFGDIIYALGMNITKKICMGLGQQVHEIFFSTRFCQTVAA
jgi:hypothetical protein